MQDYLKAVVAGRPGANRLFDFLNVRLASAADGRSEIIMPVSFDLAQGGGLVAGGILATLADEAMAHAVMTLLAPGADIVTIEMNIRYLRAVNPSDPVNIVSIGNVLKNGRRVVSAESRVSDSGGRLLAVAGGSFQVITKESPTPDTLSTGGKVG